MMKAVIILVILFNAVYVSVQTCGGPDDCGEGSCCVGSFSRKCLLLSREGASCQPEYQHTGGIYSYACPCENGYICSPINRCQKA
uniref:U1-hexatoxin-Hi1f_1 n=1 Tax=Hadronyche infensa TaxID=153481 RepID=A0A1D0BPN2_HADIN